MKRNENKSNRNRSLVVLLVLCAMLAVTLVGCKKPATENPAPSTSEVVSEEVSEPVSEPVSEEPSEEVVSEEVSEEAAEEVEVVNFSNTTELLEYINGFNKTTIAEFNFSQAGSSQSIIPNGSKYTMQLGNMIGVMPFKEVDIIEANSDNISIMSPMEANIWMVFINETGTDIEVSCTIKYADGTEEDITVYVTTME